MWRSVSPSSPADGLTSPTVPYKSTLKFKCWSVGLWDSDTTPDLWEMDVTVFRGPGLELHYPNNKWIRRNQNPLKINKNLNKNNIYKFHVLYHKPICIYTYSHKTKTRPKLIIKKLVGVPNVTRQRYLCINIFN